MGSLFEGCGADFDMVLVIGDRSKPSCVLHRMPFSGRLLRTLCNITEEKSVSLFNPFVFLYQIIQGGTKLTGVGCGGIF